MHRPHGQGLAEALLSYGLSEERAHHYEHEVRTGHYFVCIETEHEKVNSLANCLQCYGGRDIEKWKKERRESTFGLEHLIINIEHRTSRLELRHRTSHLTYDLGLGLLFTFTF